MVCCGIFWSGQLGFKMLILVSECNVYNMESPKIEQINLCLELKDY